MVFKIETHEISEFCILGDGISPRLPQTSSASPKTPQPSKHLYLAPQLAQRSHGSASSGSLPSIKEQMTFSVKGLPKVIHLMHTTQDIDYTEGRKEAEHTINKSAENVVKRPETSSVDAPSLFYKRPMKKYADETLSAIGHSALPRPKTSPRDPNIKTEKSIQASANTNRSNGGTISLDSYFYCKPTSPQGFYPISLRTSGLRVRHGLRSVMPHTRSSSAYDAQIECISSAIHCNSASDVKIKTFNDNEDFSSKKDLVKRDITIKFKSDSTSGNLPLFEPLVKSLVKRDRNMIIGLTALSRRHCQRRQENSQSNSVSESKIKDTPSLPEEEMPKQTIINQWLEDCPNNTGCTPFDYSTSERKTIILKVPTTADETKAHQLA
ncbi:uncharacterized protein LOC117114022 [Anneissia japonica]|uniref:uncharacterized protein LOC117114022 n=1 Tax=Anneissia japonica TaxID=1529436 RepID=UPI001425A5C1|nr:uncharacterized protein LOC117114022 [Anneissia japonica]